MIKENKCVCIITGMERSGTTYISKLVNSHSNIFSGFECGILLEDLNKFDNCLPFSKWLAHPNFHFGLPKNYLNEIKYYNYDNIYDYIYIHKGSYDDNIQKLIKKSDFFVDKTPRYIYHFEEIYNKSK